MPDRNVTLEVASTHFGLSKDLLRRFIKGQAARYGRNEYPPILLEDTHWFKRTRGRNAPYILRLEACEKTLAEHGYFDPGTKEDN